MWNRCQYLLTYGFPTLGQLGNFPVKLHSPCSRKRSSKDISVFEMLRKAPLETCCVFFGTRPGEHPRLIPAAAMIHAMWRSVIKKSVEEELLVGRDFQWSGDSRTYSVQTFQSSSKYHWLVTVKINQCLLAIHNCVKIPTGAHRFVWAEGGTSGLLLLASAQDDKLSWEKGIKVSFEFWIR